MRVLLAAVLLTWLPGCATVNTDAPQLRRVSYLSKVTEFERDYFVYLPAGYSERFAAVNPIVGFAHPDLVGPIAENQVPVWYFAGERDCAVPVEYFYVGIDRLEQLGHNDMRFTVEADINHDVWSRVYAGEDIYLWMLSQSNKGLLSE